MVKKWKSLDHYSRGFLIARSGVISATWVRLNLPLKIKWAHVMQCFFRVKHPTTYPVKTSNMLTRLFHTVYCRGLLNTRLCCVPGHNDFHFYISSHYCFFRDWSQSQGAKEYVWSCCNVYRLCLKEPWSFLNFCTIGLWKHYLSLLYLHPGRRTEGKGCARGGEKDVYLVQNQI